MSNLPRIGVRLHQGLTPRECVVLAQAAEAAGFASVWFAENPFDRGVLPAVSACAAVTERIGIGVGIVSPYTHHPAQIAMEFGALDELANGRMLLGIGSGIGVRIERLGFAYRPLASLEDAVHIVRGLLRGDEVTYRGRVFSADRAKLGFRPPRPEMPIYLASMGDKSLALCGRIGDGLIVSNMCPPGYTERAVAIVGDSATAAGRPMPRVVQYVPCVVRPDRAEARRAALAAIADMLARFWPTERAWPPLRDTILRHSGIPKPEFVAALDRLRHGDPAEAALDERFLAAFAVAGTAADCLARAANYRTAGVDELVLTFAGPQPAADMAYLGAAIRTAL
ncbi:MAG TPA: LLM class flavin-dependent oxidoreductase [Stellaceae bacterium]|jgi:5,10-methylenetetrahydromethanopterin reductase|nr:LLM class flavin-dependent oxidoreductase [Stellaceae bacterium]